MIESTPKPNNKGLKYPELMIQKIAKTVAKPKMLFMEDTALNLSSNVFFSQKAV